VVLVDEEPFVLFDRVEHFLVQHVERGCGWNAGAVERGRGWNAGGDLVGDGGVLELFDGLVRELPRHLLLVVGDVQLPGLPSRLRGLLMLRRDERCHDVL
jgi:hypothetical protein